MEVSFEDSWNVNAIHISTLHMYLSATH